MARWLVLRPQKIEAAIRLERFLDRPEQFALFDEIFCKLASAQCNAFVNLIEARRFDLYDDPMPSMNDLEGYLGETSSVLMHLAARVLAGEEALALADVTGMTGVAYGLTQNLLKLPEHTARGQCYLPGDLLSKYDLTPAHIISRRSDQAVDMVLSELRHHAEARLNEAREQMSSVPAAVLPALWPAGVIDLYLKQMTRVGAAPLQKPVEVSQFRRQARLLKLSLTEAF